MGQSSSSSSKVALSSCVKDFYTFAPAPAHLIVDVFLREKGVSAEEIKAVQRHVDLPNLENRSKSHKAMNPQGSIPWFVTPDGTVIAETIAMCEYVEENLPERPLIGANSTQRGVVRMWQRRMEENFCAPATYSHRNWCHSTDCPADHGMKNFYSDRFNAEQGSSLLYSNPGAWKDLAAWARHRLTWLEAVKREEASQASSKEPSDFICGDFLSVVDIQVYVNLWYWDTFCPGQHFFKQLRGQVPWVEAWYARMHERPAVAAARAASGYLDLADESDKVAPVTKKQEMVVDGDEVPAEAVGA